MIQSTASLIAEVDGELELNATACGPSAALSVSNRSATVSSASSHVIGSHPGSAASFGLERRRGCSNRVGWSTMSGAAFPFRQSARPVGWDGSGRSATNFPSSTVARAPQRETHSGQYVGIVAPPMPLIVIPARLPRNGHRHTLDA